MNKNFVAHYVIYLDDWFLEDSVENSIDFVDKVVIARTLSPWNGKTADTSSTEKTLETLKTKFGKKVEIYERNFENEQEQRNFLMEKSKAEGYKGAFIIDADEIFLPEAFYFLYSQIKNNNPATIRTSYLTFIKDASFCISPPYETNLFYVSLSRNVRFTWARDVNVTQNVVETENPAIFHFSYLRKTDEEIRQKIENFMHNKDTDWEKWYEEVYKRFNKNLRNFHPVWPGNWKSLQPFDVSKFPISLYKKLKTNGKLFYYEKILNNSNLKLYFGTKSNLRNYIKIHPNLKGADLNLAPENIEYFDDSSVSEILFDLPFLNLSELQREEFLLESNRILKPEGKLKICAETKTDILDGNILNEDEAREKEEEFSKGSFPDVEFSAEQKKLDEEKSLISILTLLENFGFETEQQGKIDSEIEDLPCNINVTATKPLNSQNAIQLAEKFLQSGDTTTAERILNSLLRKNENNADALTDLAFIKIQTNQIKEATKLLEKAIAIQPGNDIVLENFYYIAENYNFPLEWHHVHSLKEFEETYKELKESFENIRQLKNNLKEKDGLLKGICPVCGKIVDFAYSEIKSDNDWRESLICNNCGLNARLRATLHFLLSNENLNNQSKIYITEQLTPLYDLLKRNFPNLVGSEFLGNEIPRGSVNENEIRNEDATQLKFANSTFDFVLALEILEHIPDYKSALSEFSRVLKKDGLLIITTPFVAKSEKNIVKAFISSDGKTFTLGHPEYHGNPTLPDKGSLCYYYFGWELLEDLRKAGFEKAFSVFYISPFYGYFNFDNLIIGIK